MISNQCPFCVWLSPTGTRATGASRCAAFPDGIPPRIQTGEQSHARRLAGDHGFVFTLAKQYAAVDREVERRVRGA